MTVTCVKKFIMPVKGKGPITVREREIITDPDVAAYALARGKAVDDAPQSEPEPEQPAADPVDPVDDIDDDQIDGDEGGDNQGLGF